jgi:hypothetical protein
MNFPYTADTFGRSKVTKTITCTAVMQLWERKKFELDDDVTKSRATQQLAVMNNREGEPRNMCGFHAGADKSIEVAA